MSQGIYMIERLEPKNKFMALSYLTAEAYNQLAEIEQFEPVGRMLMDSENKHLIYIVEMDGEWQHLRFPPHLWSALDRILTGRQDLFLVVSLTAAGSAEKCIPLRHFHDECLELIKNIEGNANYGEETATLVEAHFKETLRKVDEW